MSARILIIDDEDLFREDLASLLRDEGFVCETAEDGRVGLQLAMAAPFDVILCDLAMPEMNGLEVIERLGEQASDCAVLVLTAFGSLETAVEAFRKGAVDYLLKPVIPSDLLAKILRCVEHRRLLREVRFLRRQVSEASSGTKLVGTSDAMREIRELLAKVAPTESTVLIQGESGTGKEVVARVVHELSDRRDGSFVAVNCAALARELIESELFGHVAGAFTGAVKAKRGLFELAHDGTLFLDEIAELPVGLQAKLLRAIEHREFFPVGGTRVIPVRVRIIAATNRDLLAEIEAGRFREDLYFRLRVVEIRLPPLRDRRDDVPPLVDHFLQRLNARLKRHVLGIDHAALRILMAANWRGNARELENALERAMILTESDYIGIADLPTDLTGAAHCPDLSRDLRGAVQAFEREHIRQVLEATKGNREEAARQLGINPSTLYRRLKEPEGS